MSNRKLIILIAVILVLALGSALAIHLMQPSNTKVVVSVGGQVFGTFDLHTDQTVIIEPDTGRWHNTLVIQDGTARISESDCSNQICVKTPALTEDVIGMIVCLPHRLVIELQEG